MPLIQAVVRTRPPWDRWTEIDVPNVSACTALHRVCVFPQLEEGYCEPNPCENGAECFNLNNDYYCNCSSKFEGKNCSRLRNDCESKACQGTTWSPRTSVNFLFIVRASVPPSAFRVAACCHAVKPKLPSRSRLARFGAFLVRKRGGVGFDWTRRLQWPCDESWGRENVALSASARVIPTRSPFM